MKSTVILTIPILMSTLILGCGKDAPTTAGNQEKYASANISATDTSVDMQKVKDTSAAIAAEINKTGVYNLSKLIADARTKSDFNAGHIPSATSFAIDEIENGKAPKVMSILSKGTEIIIYAQNAESTESIRLKNYLKKKGLSSTIYKNGYQEWKSSMQQIENEPGN
ncbi:TPA: hypothetical protein DDW35_03505 [Candidatus Sumerlaeota bacterium]|nr:hypothetical protein [Candidatus Sumerlaeota bacterium]